MRVGAWMLEENKKIKVNELATMLGISRRTLSNWKRQSRCAEAKYGRPRYSESVKFKALLRVGREWKKQGTNVGWRPIAHGLGRKVPTRLIQKTLSRLKQLHRKKLQAKIESRRLSIKVQNRNVFWVQDGTEFNGVKYQVIKDRGPLKSISIKCNQRETGEAVIAQLEALKRERGLPLVLGTDNGSIYTCGKLKVYLEEQKIVHLKSLPRTPQHNGAVECAIRETKEVASLNQLSLESAVAMLNENRLRARLLFKSSNEMDEKMRDGYDENVRHVFFNTCKARMQKAAGNLENKRSIRMNDRMIIFKTLEEFDFIKTNRGRAV